MRLNLNNALDKVGLSWHDVFIVILLFETCWWGMFVFMDSADIVIRAFYEASKTEYHTFVMFQKLISILKLLLVAICFWYGAICQGKGVYQQVYLSVGIILDVILTLAWMMISIEESWPLSPINPYGLHYMLSYGLLRLTIYYLLHAFIKETFVTSIGPPTIGTSNGAVIGIPEQGDCRTLNCASNLGFLGKGLMAILEYYRLQVEQAFLIAVIWDMFWNCSIIFCQEFPQFAFNYISVGILGSVALNISTDDLILRCLRVVLGSIAIFLVMKKRELYVKIWIWIYTIVMVSNIILLCYICVSELDDNESLMEDIIVVLVFFSSNIAKLFVIFCSLRLYLYLKRKNEGLITRNNNEN